MIRKLMAGLFILSVAVLTAAPRITFQYDMRFVMFPRGDSDIQQIISLEEVQGDIYKENSTGFTSLLTSQEMLMRWYNSGSLDLRMGSFKVYTRFRHVYGFYEDDMYAPFALNVVYGHWTPGKWLDVKAGRFYDNERTVRRTLDGASVKVSYGKMATAVLYGAEAPSPYSGDVAPDFYGTQYLTVSQFLKTAGRGSFQMNYTMVIDGNENIDPKSIVAGTWAGKIKGYRVKAHSQYWITDNRFGDGYLAASKPMSEKLFVSGEYRLSMQKDWLAEESANVLFTGHSYESYRLGAFYSISDKIGIEATEYITHLAEESYSTTFLEAVFSYGAAGVVYVGGGDQSELEFTARLNTTLFKIVRLEGGLNYLAEEYTGELVGDYETSETGFGSFAGVQVRLFKGLTLSARGYQMKSPDFDNHFRASFNLNYRVSL